MWVGLVVSSNQPKCCAMDGLDLLTSGKQRTVVVLFGVQRASLPRRAPKHGNKKKPHLLTRQSLMLGFGGAAALVVVGSHSFPRTRE
jgi:hypothetical protein